MSEQLVVNREGRVLRLTLNREDKRNALSSELCRELVSSIEGAADDVSVGAILLDAKGPVFCAGMDLSEASRPDAAQMTQIHERLFTLGLRVPVPIVVAVQGPALGGGVGLMANGHIVIAAQGTSFALSEIRIGMWPFVIWAGVVNAIGERQALALALTGRVFSAPEALAFGLVHEIAPAIELEDRATAVAEHLASLSGETIRRGLTFVHAARSLHLGQTVRTAAQYREENFSSADFAEGVRAFHEKRKPAWPSQA